ncbi:MAG: Cobalamin import system permease protein BtuC [Methanosaeta sp. PtaU1.Bin112]|nr:MAG: Cobalamin import system permease protein BtuC [Methanosaeta sp. PtaU1.Bin112]
MIEENADAAAKRQEALDEYESFIGRKIFFISFFILLTVLLCGISISLGPLKFSILEVYATIFDRFFPNFFSVPDLAPIVVWNVRLTRVVMGVLAGIGLAVAGASMQGILRNPLASPFTLGISAGAGLGAALAIIAGVGIGGSSGLLLVANAFIFSLIPSFVIVGLARFKRATPETMILAGIAMTYIFSAVSSLLHYFSDADALKDVVVWLMGDLGKATWGDFYTVGIVLAICIPLLIWKSWDLNVMGGGDEAAKSLGINVEQTRIFIMIVASLIAAVIVCFTGMIGFIGLVAPHITRICIGGDNRFVIPASGLFGAAFLVAADIIAREAMSPLIIPVGIVTSCVGGPLFLYLIARKKKDYW